MRSVNTRTAWGGVSWAVVLLAAMSSPIAIAGEVWMPSDPGPSKAGVTGSNVFLENLAIGARWQAATEWGWWVEDLWNKNRLTTVGGPFTVILGDGRTITSSTMKMTEGPLAEAVAAHPKAQCAAEGFPGQTVRARFLDGATGLQVAWLAVLRDGANYVRQEVVLSATQGDVDIKEVVMIELPASGADVVGTVAGSPVVAGNWFFGVEHPMSVSVVKDGKARCSIKRVLPLRKGQKAAYSSVVGVTPPGQLRRGFLRYEELERAHPYRTFLHYNSWYDIAYGGVFDEAQCLERIKAFGEELVSKQGVKLDSFLFDDGWDDTRTIWEFNAGFPKGFGPLKKAAEGVGAAPGVWLSPWGGYGSSREKRLATGKKTGQEIDGQGFVLSGPRYYHRFRRVCMDFVKQYGVNQFKFDGTGSPDKQYPGSSFDSDFEAAIQLIGELRGVKPDLFINLTTGTWPSPFWTRHADSIWRGGEDHSFAGVGSDRQRWITYRDGDTYSGVVKKGPLYPLNSLMVHGIIFAEHAEKLSTDPGNDFRDEVRSYFGSGTGLQELYITPSLLTAKNWDDLAEAAKWSRANADVLADTHWVGGDPSKLEVYGWASWTERKGILVLRNPSDKAQSFAADVARLFELPEAVKGPFVGRSPWAEDSAKPSLELIGGKPVTIELKAFEVIVLEVSRQPAPAGS